MSDVGATLAVAVSDVVVRANLHALVHRSRYVGWHAVLLTNIEPEDASFWMIDGSVDRRLADHDNAERFVRRVIRGVVESCGYAILRRRRTCEEKETEKSDAKTAHGVAG